MNEAELANGGAAGGIIPMLILLAWIILLIISIWRIFTKAGKPGWASIIPIYNIIVFLDIIGRPAWWIILMLIPVVNLVIAIVVSLDLAKSFGKGAGFGVGLFIMWFLGIPIFHYILGLGSATYVGPAAAQS